MTTLYVTNNSGKELVTMYAAKEKRFPVNEAVEISFEEAEHIFGYMAQDKLPAIIRLGLIQFTNDIDKGHEKLAMFKITEEAPKENRFLSPGDDLVTPLEPVKVRAGRTVQQAA